MSKQRDQEKVAKKSGCTFNFLDLFALITGSLGFTVDIVALTGLLLTVLNFNDIHEINESALPSLPGIIGLFLVLLYSWFAISWYATRRDYRHIAANNSNITHDKVLNTWSNRIMSVVAALGALSLPLWLMWLFFVGLTTSSDLAQDLSGYLLIILVGGTFGFGFVGVFVAMTLAAIIETLMPVAYPDMLVIK